MYLFMHSSGIMFPIKAKEILPIEKLVIRSVAVRGQLGPVTVWITKDNLAPTQGGEYHFRLAPRYWTKIYEATHAPSQRTYQVLDLGDTPIVLRPGQVRSIYIHSKLDGDEGIVYDNSIPTARRQMRPRYDDPMLSIYSGKSHLSPTPFGQMPIWGWGNAWRDHREFVGQLQYGIVYKLWHPKLHGQFGGKYQRTVHALLGCQRRYESPISMLPDECLYYILNMCRWDWFDDSPANLKDQRRALKQKRRQEELQRRERARAAQARAVAAQPTAAAAIEAGAADRSCCDQLMARGSAAATGAAEANVDEDGDENFYDAEESENEQEEAGEGAENAVAMVHEMNDDDDDDSDVDEEEWDEDEEDEQDEEDEGDASDESEWERQQGYRADNTTFAFRDVSSDEDDDEEQAARAAAERQAWFRRHFARVHILRGLAQGEGDADVAVDMAVGDD